MLKYKFKSFSVAKLGNNEEENEDSVLLPDTNDKEFVNAAISDGATESSFSKEWSKLLVEHYTYRSFSKDNLPETIKQIAGCWSKVTSSKDLLWYAQQKLETGAFATFIGLTINCKEKILECVAIGDSTMFLIRKDRLLFSFPITSSQQFGNTPKLFATNNKYQTEFENSVEYAKVHVEAGDLIVLASDAIAEWICKKIEKNNTYYRTIKKLMDKPIVEFDSWLNVERHSGKIKNDDTTILLIKI
jgi:serine/threonine protein phosphatase PrpC